MARPVVRTLLSGPTKQEIRMTLTVEGVRIPDSKLDREITELVRDTESPLLFHHSSRVYRGRDTVWTAIALHTTPGIPRHMHPVVALVTAGVEMDVLGLSYQEYSDAARKAVVEAHPRGNHFKEDILQSFYDGIKRKPDTTFGNVKADVLADKDPTFQRGNFCGVIRNSAWPS
jgi:hypothetical protein